MNRVVLLTRLILLRNKWLILLLMVWPIMIALVIHFLGAGMSRDDIVALLHQESLYGVAMVAFAGSALLGAEERSGRIQPVLARKVTRSQYLAALLCAAWLPLLLYVAGFLLAGLLFRADTLGNALHLWNDIRIMAASQLYVGLVVAAASIFFSVMLPTAFAAVGTIATAAIIEYLAATFKAGLLLQSLTSFVVAILFFSAAVAVFNQKDLNLNSD